MVYENPFNPPKRVHRELSDLTTLLGIDRATAADTQLQAVLAESDEAWAQNPVCIELRKAKDARATALERVKELNALLATEERKGRTATHAGDYTALLAIDARKKEIAAELEFCNGHYATLDKGFDSLQRKADRAWQDVNRKFSLKIRQQCELDHAAKMGELLAMIRGQPDLMSLITEISVIDVLHVAFLP